MTLDPVRFSTIAHLDIAILNPVGDRTLSEVAGRLRLPARGRVLDVGCGRGEWLIRLLERYRARGVGIDRSALLIDDARARARLRGVEDRVDFHVADARVFPIPPGTFDVAICLGATHALGLRDGALRALARAVRPGGQIVVGEGYWKTEPDPDYLALLEAERDEFTDHEGNSRAGRDVGLSLEAKWASSEAEWDAYEGAYAGGIRRYLSAHPDDPDADAMRERVDRWERGYQRWGRSTLGFGIYLFRTPHAPIPASDHP